MGARDYKGVLCSALIPGTGAETTYYINAGQTYPKLGVGSPLFCHVSVDVAPTTSTSILCELYCHEDSSFSTGTKKFPVFVDSAIALLTLGKTFTLMVPPDCDEQYLKGYFTVTTTDETVGAFSMWIDQSPVANNQPWSKSPGNQIFVSPVGQP